MVPGARVALLPCLLERPAHVVTALEADSIDPCTTTCCCTVRAWQQLGGNATIYQPPEQPQQGRPDVGACLSYRACKLEKHAQPLQNVISCFYLSCKT